jgi:hypothetical protein
MLQLLVPPGAATLRVPRREMEAAGVPVLFYVAPVSPARLAENGVDAAEFAARVDELRRAVGASDEGWLDLHAAAAPSLFRDRLADHRLASAERVLEPSPGRFAGARPGSAR